MAFGLGAALGIGSSLLSAFSGASAAGQTTKDLREAKRLEHQRYLRERDTLLRQQRHERGANLVSAGVSGLDTQGSFSDLFDSNTILDQLDLENLKFNTELNERRFDRDISNARRARQNAVIGGITGIATSLIDSQD